MPLDVEVPDPPALHGPQDPGDYDAVDELDEETGGNYRREELQPSWTRARGRRPSPSGPNTPT